MGGPGEVSIAAPLVDAASVVALVRSEWDLPVRRAYFWKLGQNDTFLAETDGGRLAIRLYRHGRDRSSISYELDLIDHLLAKDVPAVASIPAVDGRRWVDVATPEGIRHLVVFPAAEGDAADLSQFPAAQYGALVGALHRETDGFSSDHSRPAMDLVALVDTPAVAALPWLGPEDAAFLSSAVGVIRDRQGGTRTQSLDWGPCHNDVIGNTLHRPDGTLSLFDFDNCGPGWRAYELATFLLQFASWGSEPGLLWDQFVSAYRRERPIGDADLAAAADFVPVRYVWLLGLHAAVGDAKGHDRDAAYLPAMMEGLRRWLGPAVPLDPLGLSRSRAR